MLHYLLGVLTGVVLGLIIWGVRQTREKDYLEQCWSVCNRMFDAYYDLMYNRQTGTKAVKQIDKYDNSFHTAALLVNEKFRDKKESDVQGAK